MCLLLSNCHLHRCNLTIFFRKLLLFTLIPLIMTLRKMLIMLTFSISELTLFSKHHLVQLSLHAYSMEYCSSTILHYALEQYSCPCFRLIWVRFTKSFNHFRHHELTSRIRMIKQQEECCRFWWRSTIDNFLCKNWDIVAFETLRWAVCGICCITEVPYFCTVLVWYTHNVSDVRYSCLSHGYGRDKLKLHSQY